MDVDNMVNTLKHAI